MLTYVVHVYNLFASNIEQEQEQERKLLSIVSSDSIMFINLIPKMTEELN